jgi:hexosaminidase
MIALLAVASVARSQEMNLLPMPMKVERIAEPVVATGIVRLIADDGFGDEEYLLNTTGGHVIITASTRAGFFYGRQTLAQLMDGEKIQQVKIADRPRFPYRGMLIDSARHMQSMEFLKKTIDRLAIYKINRLQMHLTDDVGWRVEIKKYPKLTEVGAWRGEGAKRYGGFYSQDQLRELVAYAAERFVTIIPEIEMPGHAQAAVASYPQISCSGEPTPVLAEFKLSQRPMCPSNPETYKFIEGVLDEVCAIFPSPVIHMGGDECPREPWKACQRCQAFMKEHKLKDEDALQNEFTRRVAEILRKKGRRMQGWGEITRGGNLGKDVIVHQWLEASVGVGAAKAGNDVIVSQLEALYLDFPLERTPLRKVYEFDPMPAGLSAEQARHILGPQANLWTENFPTEAAQEKQIWPRMLAVAEMGWSPQESRKWEDFSRRAKNR